jgi:hypothetical protein
MRISGLEPADVRLGVVPGRQPRQIYIRHLDIKVCAAIARFFTAAKGAKCNGMRKLYQETSGKNLIKFMKQACNRQKPRHIHFAAVGGGEWRL